MKKFTAEDVTLQHRMKSSAARVLRNQIIQIFDGREDIVDEILPKKASVVLAKCHHHNQIAVIEGKPTFFKIRDGPWIPTLRILNQCEHYEERANEVIFPDSNILQRMQVDHGAIKHVLRGSNIMCPGLTSPGGHICPNVLKGNVVQIHAEGKHSACGVGIMKMDSNEM